MEDWLENVLPDEMASFHEKNHLLVALREK